MKDLLSFDDALAQILAAAPCRTPTEPLSLIDADGRVLASDVIAPMDVPGFDNSAMDGYALNVADFSVPPALFPVVQRIAAGHAGVPLPPGCAARIFTGAPLPAGANVVVPQENASLSSDGVSPQRPLLAGQHIRRAGEDIETGTVILRAGQRLNPADLSLATSVGVASVAVQSRLRVGVFFTGDELALPGETLKPGAIYNSNRFALSAQLQRLNCVVNDYGNVPDNRTATLDALALAAEENHVVITCGGVSVGEEDHVREAVQARGELALWRIAMKPGKPLAFGRVGNAAFIGLPGNPVSAYITFCLLARPFLLQSMGAQHAPLRPYRLPAAFDWPKADARREFLRARRIIGPEGDVRVAIYPQQGSAAMSGLAWADGLVDLLPGQTVKQGDPVAYIPFNDLL